MHKLEQIYQNAKKNQLMAWLTPNIFSTSNITVQYFSFTKAKKLSKKYVIITFTKYYQNIAQSFRLGHVANYYFKKGSNYNKIIANFRF